MPNVCDSGLVFGEQQLFIELRTFRPDFRFGETFTTEFLFGNIEKGSAPPFLLGVGLIAIMKLPSRTVFFRYTRETIK